LSLHVQSLLTSLVICRPKRQIL